jgi:Site-specific recombinase XerD
MLDIHDITSAADTKELHIRDYTARVGLKNVHPHVLRNNFAKRFLMEGGSDICP